MRRRPTLALVDQVLANTSNALIVLAVARSAPAAQFGVFTVSYAVLVFAVGFVRSLLSAPIAMSAEDSDRVRDETRRALGTLLGIAPLAMAVTFAPSLLTADARTTIAILALAAPFVLIQDTLRFSALAQGRPSLAMWSDLLWALISVSIFLLNLVAGLTSVVILTAWLIGALLAAALLAALLEVRPVGRGYRTWLRNSGRMRTHLSLGTSAMSASLPLAYWIFSSTGGAAAVGAVGGAAQLMAPVNTLTGFLGFYALSHMAGSTSQSKWRQMSLAGSGLGAVAVVWGGILLWLPSTWGSALLGQTWPATRQIMPLIGIQYAIGAVAYAYTLMITSEGRSRTVLVLGLVVAGWRLGAIALAGALSNAAFALVLAELTTMILWVWVSATATRAQVRNLHPVQPDADQRGSPG